LEIDSVFPRSYEVREVGEFPGTGIFTEPVIYFPPPQTRPEHVGWWLWVSPSNSASWIGVFAFGYSSPLTFSRVIATPHPKRVCVIAKGGGYVVEVDKPAVWEKIPLIPVLDVRAIPERQMLVFADFTNLAAYGPDGLVWRSPRVCWDELKILSVTQDTIEGAGDGESRFAVDVRTGRSLLPAPISADGKPFW
jgi:hypothetical protein